MNVELEVFSALFSLINYFVGKQGVTVVVSCSCCQRYLQARCGSGSALFLLPALFTSAYLAGDTYCVLTIIIVKELEDALSWSV